MWSSKLQTEIAFSTPMRNILAELSKAAMLIVGSAIANSAVSEDNRDCIELANAPRMQPRTCLIGLKITIFVPMLRMETSKSLELI